MRFGKSGKGRLLAPVMLIAGLGLSGLGYALVGALDDRVEEERFRVEVAAAVAKQQRRLDAPRALARLAHERNRMKDRVTKRSGTGPVQEPERESEEDDRAVDPEEPESEDKRSEGERRRSAWERRVEQDLLQKEEEDAYHGRERGRAAREE